MPENTNNHPKQEDIAALAQHYWEEEGQPEGRAEEHWLRAEQKLREVQQTPIEAQSQGR